MIEGGPLAISSPRKKKKYVKEMQWMSQKHHVFSTTFEAPLVVSFGLEDLIDILHLHEDPIVIQATIHGAKVAQILVDT